MSAKAIGLSNFLRVKESKEMKGLQFYDFDGEYCERDLQLISALFDNDCIMYKTKNGTHFISFTITDGTEATIKSNQLSVCLKQNFIGPTLCLRVSAKFRENKKVSPVPSFVRILKEPRQGTEISLNHLNLYKKRLGLPSSVYRLYIKKCVLIKCRYFLCVYKTKSGV